LDHLFSGTPLEEGASLLSISRIKQRLSLAVALSKVLSKFLTKILHLSTQAFDRSITHLALTDTNADFPCTSLSCFDGFF